MDDSFDAAKICCLIVSDYSGIDEEKYINFLKLKLRSLIMDGYNYFIAYDAPHYKFTALQVIDGIRKELRYKVNIEYVIVNCNSKRYTGKTGHVLNLLL